MPQRDSCKRRRGCVALYSSGSGVAHDLLQKCKVRATPGDRSLDYDFEGLLQPQAPSSCSAAVSPDGTNCTVVLVVSLRNSLRSTPLM